MISKFLRKDFHYYVFLAIVFCLPLTKRYIPILMLVWIISSITNMRWKELKKSDIYLLVIFPSILYIIHVIGLIYSEDFKNGLFDLEVKLTILFIPVVILALKNNARINYGLILKVFVFGNLIASLVCIYLAVQDSMQIDELGNFAFELSVWPEHTRDYSIFKLLSSGFSQFSYAYLSKIHHPTYFSIYITFSIVVLISFIKKGTKRIIYLILIVYFTLFLWLLASRAAFITYFLVISIYFISAIIRGRKPWIALVALLLGTTFLFFIISNSRLNKNIKESIEYIKDQRNLDQDSDVRLWLWKSGIEVFKKNLLFGVGTGDINNELNKKYKEYELEDAYKQNMNTHNQYLDVAIKLGLVGLVVFLSWFIYAIIYSLKRKQFLFFYFLIIFFINFFFEVILNTIAGVSFFVFFYSLLYAMYNRYNEGSVAISSSSNQQLPS